jgi:hypothetical protein
MRTVGQHGGMIFPVGAGIGATQLECAVMSAIRAAGKPPISTVSEALAIMPGPAGTHAGRMQGTVESDNRAAGGPPMSTLGWPETMAKGSGGWGTGVGVGAGG